jgi:hypothetical protein
VARPARLDAIDHVLALDLGRRGVDRFFVRGGALAAARALRGARRVVLVTGFCVPPGIAETDGPPGAVVLGRALRGLGARVRYVTDEPVAGPLRAVLEAAGEPDDVDVPAEDADLARAVLARERPTHLVAIERPGRARSGDYLSARGESIAAWNRPLDRLFVEAASRRPARRGRRSAPGARPVTIGVGDGGNEIGMGNVRRRLLRQGPLMARIASVVRVDHLVVAGASNWGAYGIVAALGALTRRPLLHPPALERRMLEACVKAGAVDGITRRAEATVDGLPPETQEAIVELLGRAVSWAP